MIGIDANVLLRSILGDDADQSERARAFLASLTPESPGFICREVILETVWVLERSYRFPREHIAAEIIFLIGRDNVIVETVDDVGNAMRLYRDSNHGFSDLLIFEASRRMGALPLYTFDRRFSRIDGVALVGE